MLWTIIKLALGLLIGYLVYSATMPLWQFRKRRPYRKLLFQSPAMLARLITPTLLESPPPEVYQHTADLRKLGPILNIDLILRTSDLFWTRVTFLWLSAAVTLSAIAYSLGWIPFGLAVVAAIAPAFQRIDATSARAAAADVAAIAVILYQWQLNDRTACEGWIDKAAGLRRLYDAVRAAADGADRQNVSEDLADDEEVEPQAEEAAEEADEGVPRIGHEIAWSAIVRQVFRVREFDRTGTTIDEDNEVHAANAFEPYGYLSVESPILNHPLRLPIVHRDDFLLAASVFDEPKFAKAVAREELLVTYAPKQLLPHGLAGGTTHALHYVITPRGTLQRYYGSEGNDRVANPEPEKLFGPFVYEGSGRVQVNPNPQL